MTYDQSLDLQAYLQPFNVHDEHLVSPSLNQEVSRVVNVVDQLQESMEQFGKSLLRRSQSGQNLDEIKRSTNKLVEDIIILQDFLTLNLSKLKSRLPAKGKSISQQGLQEQLNTSLACVVSDIYSSIKSAGAANTVWQAPSSFERSTTKYWVKDENLTNLLVTCAQEAPLLVYGKKGPLTDPSKQSSDGDLLWGSLATRITSVYFDSPDMSLYTERLARAEGAQLLRARWYGDTMPRGEGIIFLELKTHHEKWVAQKSVKERASVREDDVSTFLEPVAWKREDAEKMVLRASTPKDLSKATNLLLRMHNLVVKHKLTACVRSVYWRAAFQSPKSNDLRLTLDRTVTLVDERARSPGTNEWCLADDQVQSAKSTVVPFNVFEVKLAGDDPMPPGLQKAEDTGVIEIATKFSKFLTGAAAFNTVTMLPYWAAHPAFRSFFGLDKAYNIMQEDDYVGYDAIDPPSPEALRNIKIAPKKPARVEPKTYMANERTFIQWVSAAILLLSVASLLIRNGYDGTAAVISLSAFCLVIYSYRLYFARLQLLKVREPYGYFNKISPTVLTVLVGVAVVLVLLDSVTGRDLLTVENEQQDSRYLQVLAGRRSLQENYESCTLDVARAHLPLGLQPNAMVSHPRDNAFLLVSDSSIYSVPKDDSHAQAKKIKTIVRSNLVGLAVVNDRIFAVSSGPEQTELLEMTFGKNQKLFTSGRWDLLDSPSMVNGFSFVPETNRFVVSMASSIHYYSVPTNDQPPKRLTTLNSNILVQSSNDSFNGQILHMNGYTYILFPRDNVIQTWDLAQGHITSQVKLPKSMNGRSVLWHGFALDHQESPCQLHGVRGAQKPVRGSTTESVLHLMTMTTNESQIWTFSLSGKNGDMC